MERDKLTDAVAKNIRELMERQKISAPRLAERAQLNPTGIYDILSGKSRSPRLDTIVKIALALGVPASRLLEEERACGFRNQIIEVFSQLPEDEQRRLILTARAWLLQDTAE